MSYTKADNWLFDDVMPEASPNAFKVVCAVVRMTAGWHREEVRLTYDDLHEMTGIGGRSTLNSALSEALEQGWIRREKDGKGYLYRPVCSTETGLQTSTETGLQAPESVRKQDRYQYGNRTDISTDSVLQPGDTFKEKKKKEREIYIRARDPDPDPPPDVPPLHSGMRYELPTPGEEEVERMLTAITGTCKETRALGVNEDRFQAAAAAFIREGYSPDQVRAFREWWTVNGYYNGKPALKTMLQEMSNAIEGIRAGDRQKSTHKTSGNRAAMERVLQEFEHG